MKANNPWDALSDFFDTSKNSEEIPSKVADNVYIAWPVFLNVIAAYMPNGKNKKALDYGCGGGGFAQKLSELGFSVTGIDSSKDMIVVAKKAYGKHIAFYASDTSILQKIKPFDVITSIMTLQFIKDIETTIKAFSESLTQNGLLIFAVHNPDYIKEQIKKNTYPFYDSANNPTQVTLRFQKTIDVPMYIRTADEYVALAKKYHLKKLLEVYPPFTKEFIQKFPDYAGINHSEYLIVGFKKE